MGKDMEKGRNIIVMEDYGSKVNIQMGKDMEKEKNIIICLKGH